MNYIKKFSKPIILFLCVVIVGYAFISMHDGRGSISYADHLEDTAFTIDGVDYTFEDLAFYILYEERVIETQAMIYNPDSTKDYWNLHSNDAFIQEEAKDAILGMAVHDRLFYSLAVEDGMDELTEDELEQLEFSKCDFWEDLLDQQWDRLPTDEDTINEQMRILAVAEKYQNYLAETKGPSVASYKYDGYYYSLIKDEHDVTVNSKLWDRLVVGDITINHDSFNAINGLTDEEKKKDKE